VSPTWTKPGAIVVLILSFIGVVLGADQFATVAQQRLLGVATALLLVTLTLKVSPQLRAQVLVVVATATVFEVIGSIIWGVYRYRLGNLPLFVPPGHGLVYLGGAAIAQMSLVRRYPVAFSRVILALAGGWAILGLTGVLGRVDVMGAAGCVVLAAFLLFGPAPTVLGGVFLVVGALEIYGTALGTWRWAETIPGLGVTQGNPPSGAASGYVFFDLVALALAPALLALCAAALARFRRPAAELGLEAP
jgi:hypothetical protein